MNYLVFDNDIELLRLNKSKGLKVALYNVDHADNRIATIGNPIIEKIQRLGVSISNQAMDFLHIAMAVTAADTFVKRSSAADGWTRELHLKLPLIEVDRWQTIKTQIENALNFLSGDIWSFDFVSGGYPTPKPFSKRKRYKVTELTGLDCVSLYSGGLDSAVGVIDLFSSERRPLLVSHSYKGDNKRQKTIVNYFSESAKKFSQFSVNANPVSNNYDTDITMRTRSLNFLAFAAVGASAVCKKNSLKSVDLFVPENGFISLNAPLTSRRVGSLSTRTTHPHFLSSIQEIFDLAGIKAKITNPYQYKTKGEMVEECLDKKLLNHIYESTVSCSHWKRANMQCGVCVPCLIRKASLYRAKMIEKIEYQHQYPYKGVLIDCNKRDDIMALKIAIKKLELGENIWPWLLDSGPLPYESKGLFEKVFKEGLNEVKKYMIHQKLI